MCRFRTADDLPVFSNLSKGLYQTLGILPRVAEQSEESRFAPVVRMGLVQQIVEYLAAIDDGKVSVAELHVARIVPRGAPAIADQTVDDLSRDGRLPAKLCASNLQRTRRRSCGQRAAQDDRLEVRPHHPLHAKLLGDSTQFIELEALAAPRRGRSCS